MKQRMMIVFLIFQGVFVFSQGTEDIRSDIPAVFLKTLDGKTFNTAQIENKGNPVIISFFALWCTPCLRELSAISEVYEDWVDETGVKVIAVSIDDARSSARVLPTVRGRGWNFEVLLDPNGDFKRAMNVNLIPHNFLLDGNGKIIWQHTSFSEGSQHQLFEMVKMAKADKILNKVTK